MAPAIRFALCLLSIVTAFRAADASAAEIARLTPANSDIDVIAIVGPIAPGDGKRFSELAATSSKALVVLNSEGGQATAALEIGRAIRLKGFATTAPGLCASACALIWLSGNPRFIEKGSHIGFHAAYITRNGKMLEKGAGNALIGAYLSQLGYSDRAIVFVTSAPPEGMEWLTTGKARSNGIEFVALEGGNDAAPTPAARPKISSQRYDPISTVTKFYAALSEADGDAAAALVVPSKRGIGAFNEANISRFYADMRQPLTLKSVRRVAAHRVSAEYHYVPSLGRACNGTAEVTTTYQFGRTLIETIRTVGKRC